MPKTATAYQGATFGSYGSAANGTVPGAFSRTDTSSTAAATGNSADSLSASANGARLDVNLTALTGTSPTIAFALWDSADNTTFAAVPGATIAALSSTGRASVTVPDGTVVRRYVAVATTVTGTTPSATFTASVVKHAAAFTPAQNPDHSSQKDTRN